jgi:DNA polymerase IIIc chi subunit
MNVWSWNKLDFLYHAVKEEEKEEEQKKKEEKKKETPLSYLIIKLVDIS